MIEVRALHFRPGMKNALIIPAVLGLATAAACGSVKERPAEEDASMPAPFARFDSARVDGEVTILEELRPELTRMLSREEYAWGDPLGLRSLFESYENNGGALSAQELAWVDALLQDWDEVESYLRERVTIARTMDGISAAIAMSRLVAYLQNSRQLPAGSAARADDAAFEAFDVAFDSLVAQLSEEWPAVFLPDVLAGPLSYPGSDCGAAPPADGSAPPDVVNTVEEIIQQGRQLLEDDGDSVSAFGDYDDYAPHLRAYRNHVEWWQVRFDSNHEDHDPAQHDSLAISEDLLQRLKAALETLKAGPTGGGGARAAGLEQGSFGELLERQAVFEASLRSHLAWGAQLDVHDLFDSLDLDTEEIAFFENTTYRNGAPDPTLVDGRFHPGIRRQYAPGSSEVEMAYDAPNEHIAIAFQPWRISRELSHIDFRLRRMGDEQVLAEFRSVENDEGEIAFGHTFALDPFKPAGPAYETYVVHAVPIDSANHATRGACAFVYVKWGPQIPEEETFPSPEPIPPMPFDRICDDWRMDPITTLHDIPPRNIELRTSFNPAIVSHRVLPDTLFIGTSGETIQITNLDSSPHRYVTTNNFHFTKVGSTELDGPSVDPSAQRYLDTGLMASSSERILQLPVDNDDPDNGDDLPSPYWFNLIEVEEGTGGQLVPVEDSPPIHIVYQNPECL